MKGLIYMNREFFKRNRKNLVEKLEDNSIIILFSGKAPKKSADEAYNYTPNRNFYYLTGIEEEGIILLITKINGKIEENLFIKKADPVMERWVGKTINHIEATAVSAVENICFMEEFEATIHKSIFSSQVQNIYFDFERDAWNSTFSEAEITSKSIIEKYPYIKIKNVYHHICELRTVKSEEERVEIRKALKITGMGIENILKNAKPGMMEYEIEAYFDFILKSNGIKDYAFKTIAASGKNATILHYAANKSQTKAGDLMLLDLGAQWNYYNGDISRTFPVNGKFTERQKLIYNIVLKAQAETIKIIKPGIPFKDLNLTTRKVFLEELGKIGLVKDDKELSNYYFHNVSHYLGLDTHDVGSREAILTPGMVLTVEPGLYIEEESIGIRIEDNVVVTESGCDIISKDIIKTVEEIESFMNNK
jgi:Xaa-Pro aminopeptidase